MSTQNASAVNNRCKTNTPAFAPGLMRHNVATDYAARIARTFAGFPITTL